MNIETKDMSYAFTWSQRRKMFSMAPSCKGVFTTRPRWKRWVNTTSTSGSGWTPGFGAASWDRVNTLSSFLLLLLFQFSLYSIYCNKVCGTWYIQFQARSLLTGSSMHELMILYFRLIIFLSYLPRMPCDNRSYFFHLILKKPCVICVIYQLITCFIFSDDFANTVFIHVFQEWEIHKK